MERAKGVLREVGYGARGVCVRQSWLANRHLRVVHHLGNNGDRGALHGRLGRFFGGRLSADEPVEHAATLAAVFRFAQNRTAPLRPCWQKYQFLKNRDP